MHGSASAVRDRMEEPQAGKNHWDHENDGEGVHGHAMPIIIDAFRAFVFREVWDWRVVWRGMPDRGFPPMTSVRGSHSRPELYDTGVSFVKVPGNHGGICPYLSRANAASEPEVRNRACRMVCANFGLAALDLHHTLTPFAMQEHRSRR
jgi:hypothetical protein